jgi:hypothetical protein
MGLGRECPPLLVSDYPGAHREGETGAREAEIKGWTCNWRADKAIAQVVENKARSCGFGGLRWLDSRQANYDWCNNFNPGLPAMRGENNTREAILAQQG